MNKRLQELTQKIYKEGVTEAQRRAEKIISQAENEAKDIISAAEAEAEERMMQAAKTADEIGKNMRSELQLYARRAVDALKTEITELIAARLAAEAVGKAIDGKAFMQKIILTLVENWPQDEPPTIETSEAEELTAFFASQAKKLLEKGVTIRQVNGIKTGFAIVAAEKGYKITFTDEDLTAYFKEFLRPKLAEMLF